MKNKYKDLTIEDIEKAMKELNIEDAFVKKLSKEEIERLRHTMGNFVVDGLGENIYKAPGGLLMGDGGLELFHKAFLKEARKWKTNI